MFDALNFLAEDNRTPRFKKPETKPTPLAMRQNMMSRASFLSLLHTDQVYVSALCWYVQFMNY